MLRLDIESFYLVGGFKHVLFSISYMGRHPIDFHIFQDGYCTTNQLLLYVFFCWVETWKKSLFFLSMLPPEDLDLEEEAEEEHPTAAWLNKSCEIRMGSDGKLVGGLEPWNSMIFHILGIIIPTDLHIFQRGWNHQPDGNWWEDLPADCFPAAAGFFEIGRP